MYDPSKKGGDPDRTDEHVLDEDAPDTQPSLRDGGSVTVLEDDGEYD